MLSSSLEEESLLDEESDFKSSTSFLFNFNTESSSSFLSNLNTESSSSFLFNFIPKLFYILFNFNIESSSSFLFKFIPEMLGSSSPILY